MTVTERIEAAKRLANAGGRGVELGRRDLVMAKQAIEKALKEINEAYADSGGRFMDTAAQIIEKV